MQHKKRESVNGEWAKKGVDIMNGDKLRLISGGTEIEGKFGLQVVFKVETRNGQKNIPFNQTSINAFVDEYGEEDTAWVGKTANVIVVRIPGKDPFYYFAPDGYEIGDRGLEKPGVQKTTTEDVPTIQVDEEVADDDIPLESIPF